jgi:hypothetical protein
MKMNTNNLSKDQYIKHLEGRVAEFDWQSGEPVYTIAVDFDRTLAHYNPSQGQELGEPIPSMLARVKDWIKDGKAVVIFTKRAQRTDQQTLNCRNLKKYGMTLLSQWKRIQVNSWMLITTKTILIKPTQDK